MKITTYKCDRCGKEILTNPIEIEVHYLDRQDDELVLDTVEPEWGALTGKHFCRACIKHLIEGLTSGEIKVIEPKPDKRVYQKVDVQKLWALNDAGWSVTQIAGELGVSSTIVRKYLKEERPAMETADTTPRELEGFDAHRDQDL